MIEATSGAARTPERPGDDVAEDDAGEVGQTVEELRDSLGQCIAQIGQLETALDSRDVIGQAKGILMALQHVTADAAFDILRRASQRTNVKLRDVAADLVARMSDEVARMNDEPPTEASSGAGPTPEDTGCSSTLTVVGPPTAPTEARGLGYLDGAGSGSSATWPGGCPASGVTTADGSTFGGP